MTTNTTPNAYQSFLLDLYKKGESDQNYAKAYNSIPDMFIEQARQGYDMAFLNASHVSNVRYATASTNTDFFRVVIQDPRHEVEGISCKIVLQGFHDSKMEMIASSRVRPRPDKAKGESYLRNFSSQVVGFSQRSVDAGSITQEEYADLLEYTAWWEGVEREFGNNATFNKKEFSRIRRYLVAKNAAFFIGFGLEERQNTSDRPTDMPITIGTHSIVWSNVFIDSRPGLPYQTVGAADSAGKTAPAPIAEGYHTIETVWSSEPAATTAVAPNAAFALPPRK